MKDKAEKKNSSGNGGADTVPRAKILVGKAINRLGHISIPAGVGIIAGFWIADREIRFLPTTLGLVLIVFVIGALAIPAGRILQGEAFEDTPDRKRLRKRIGIFAALAILAVIARLILFWAEAPSPLTSMEPADFNRAFEQDSAMYRDLERGMERSLAYLESRRDLFDADDPPVLGPEDEERILAAWRDLYDHGFALDQIRVFYEDWFRFDPSRTQRSYHLRSFLLTYAAELALYEKSTRAILAISANPNAVKFLNSPHPDAGLGADTFSFFRQQLQGNKDRARVEAGERYLAVLDKGLKGRAEARGLGVGWLWKAVENHLAAIRATAPMKKTALGVASDLEALKRPVRRGWYPTQKKIAEWMGDTKVRRTGYLIAEEQVAKMDPKLQPGDILLSRKNWYLSNIGLPGFWPHAIIYLGDPDKMSKYFDDPEVKAWLETSCDHTDMAGCLSSRFPLGWARYNQEDDGHPHRVVEAVSEGVVFNTLEHAAGDYLVALRPRLNKVAKARAITEAFGHLGKPYDFDFDFATDHALVCTELVWRSYREAGGAFGDSLDLPLTEVMGRMTLPANEIAAKYADERGEDDRQLDFVYFLDAKEKDGRAVVSDEKTFARTPGRTKWDIALP